MQEVSKVDFLRLRQSLLQVKVSNLVVYARNLEVMSLMDAVGVIHTVLMHNHQLVL